MKSKKELKKREEYLEKLKNKIEDELCEIREELREDCEHNVVYKSGRIDRGDKVTPAKIMCCECKEEWVEGKDGSIYDLIEIIVNADDVRGVWMNG